MNTNYLPLISVVMPCYNSRLDFFQEAIESVLSQSYTNWEVVIVNDGSNKDFKLYLESFISNLDDKRFTVVHLDRNSGTSIAMNTGIEASSGEIITILDSDDIHLPWFYEEIVNSFIKNPDTSVLISNSIYYWDLWGLRKQIYQSETLKEELGNHKRASDILESIKAGKQKTTPIFSFKRSVFNTIKFDPNICFGEDLDLFLQIVNEEKHFVHRLEVGGYLYRWFPSRSRIIHNNNLLFSDIGKIIKKHVPNINSPAFEYINHLQLRSDKWRFWKPMNDFLKEGSIFNYFRDIILHYKSFKDMVRGIKLLADVMFVTRLLMPLFGIKDGYIRALFSFNRSRKCRLKERFISYLDKMENEKASLYARKTYERIFSK